MPQRYNRTASTIITLFGAVTNSLLTIQVLAAWHAVKWEPESEWELSGDKWQLTGIKVLWGLLSLYFALNALVCSVGLHGILKVRFCVVHLLFALIFLVAQTLPCPVLP